MTVSSTGPAARVHPDKMGVYHLVNSTFNEFPVYQKKGGRMFLYVSNFGYWSIRR